jgi:MSHA biogenesis protein MshL
MTRILLMLIAAAMAGCATPPRAPTAIEPNIMSELEKAGQRKPAAQAQAVEAALLPPLRMEMPSAAGRPIEPRFDLSVNDAPATQVFMSIVSGTRYSMLVHPSVSGSISVNLKDVNILEALESIRELYGFEYRIDGSRISIQPAGLQTRIYRVNYLTGQRTGTSDLRVQSGSVTDSASTASAPPQASLAAPVPAPGVPVPGSATGGITRALESSRVSMRQVSNFWTDLNAALLAIIGTGEGRTVVVTPQSGVVVLRAFPAELRAVEQYLRESRLAIERQVMLEAKIIEVTLSQAYQSGINWAAFRNASPRIVAGQSTNATGSTQLVASGGGDQTLQSGGQSIDPANRIALTASSALAAANPASAIFGIALQTSNFAALLQFLESQGSVQVLSSPRVATINNQKAILKVGTDQFFVTNVSTVTTTTAIGTQQTPTVTVAPFFSGIVLDVTPQINDTGSIMLHVHPSVSEVVEDQRVVNLGGSIPSITLPLAKSTVSETDTIVRVSDGNIVAIGGLMSVDTRDNRGGLPGVGEFTSFLRNANVQSTKKELVILLRPTIILGDSNWEQDVRDTQERFRNLYPPQTAAPRPQ